MTQHNQDAYLTQDFINIMPIWWCILITISIPLFWIFWRHRKPFFNVSRSCRSKKLISQQNFAFSPFLTLFFEKNQQEVDQMSPNFNPSKFLHLSRLRFSPKPRITFLVFFRFCILINILTLFFCISDFFRPKVTNLQNGDVFCIFKKISFFIYEFLRGWFSWNFDFCVFYTNLLLPVHVVRHQFGNYPQIWSLKVKLPSLVTWLENVVLY